MRLYVLGYNWGAWARRYGIEPIEYACSECGRLLMTTRPFAQGQLRGLQAPPCVDCGNERTPYVMVRDPKYGDLLKSPLLE